ncbi:MAG: hypothetical protein AAF564_10475 [Bacteroidota bacterium]
MFLAGTSLQQAVAQPVQPEIRIAVQEDNPIVFVYHTAMIPIGHGFNIYRKDGANEEYEQLNTYPIRGVASGTELRAFLGTLYDDIEQTTGQSTDNGTLTKLRSDFKTANLLTFIYPEIAASLGRIYEDQTATLDAPATYKIEFVDALDAPTGDVLEQTALLLPQKPDAPTQLRAENQGNLITLYWRYIPPNENADDKVIRFDVYRVDPMTNQHQQLNKKVVLRNNALFEYALTFEVPTVGQTEQLYVRSVDITGQESDQSVILRYDAIDLDPPNEVLEADARPLSGQRVQVSWRSGNTNAAGNDIAGFNVYRSTALHDEAAYTKLNAAPLGANTTLFNDTLSVSTGGDVYFYRVTAIDASGNEGARSTAAMALVADQTPPPAIGTLRAEANEDGTVSLDWRAPRSATDFETFIVLRQRLGQHAPALPMRINPATLTTTSLVDRGEAGRGFYEGATYKYTVHSADASGNFSAPVTTTLRIPDETAPVAPNGVQAVVENNARIAVFWNPSPARDVMSYVVYRREAGSSKLIATPVPAHTRRLEDQQVERGTTYAYWVTAADSAGNESLQSDPFEIQMRDYAAPRSVRNVKLSADDGTVSIAWEPVSAFDMAGYEVLRASRLTGTYAAITSHLLTDNSWQDEASSTNRCYRVLAIDTSGNRSRPSQPVCIRPTASQ